MCGRDTIMGDLVELEKLVRFALAKGARPEGPRYHLALHHSQIENRPSPIPAAKCPFTPQPEMITKLWGSEGPAKPVQGTLF